MRISDWSSDVCSSDLVKRQTRRPGQSCGTDRCLAWPCAAEGDTCGHQQNPGRHESALGRERHRRGAARGAPGEVRDGQGLRGDLRRPLPAHLDRSEEHTSELQSIMRISYAVFCLKKKIKTSTS